MSRVHSRPFLFAELVLLTLGIPLALYWFVLPKLILPTIWLMALYCHMVVRTLEHTSSRPPWGVAEVTWRNLQPILLRFGFNAIVLTVLTVWLEPDVLLGFVRQNPAFWLLVMVAYPLLSVIPQEIIFRAYFFSRYKALFPGRIAMIAASGLTFGLAHIIFHNWVAPVLCTAGGLLFASTYHRTRSVLLVAIEHALYGDFLFTLGLGRYFYHGSIAAAAGAH